MWTMPHRTVMMGKVHMTLTRWWNILMNLIRQSSKKLLHTQMKIMNTVPMVGALMTGFQDLRDPLFTTGLSAQRHW
jgi:hypothetical protein